MRKRKTIDHPISVPGSSCFNPAPAGVTVKTMIERGDPYASSEFYNVEITLLDFLRGKEVWEHIKAQRVLDESLKPGFEYILPRIRFGYFLKGRGFGNQAHKVTKDQFAAVSTDGNTQYEIPTVLRLPEPSLIDRVFSPGESREGWILLQVPKEDKKPLLIFKRDNVDGIYAIWGYVWFQLY